MVTSNIALILSGNRLTKVSMATFILLS